jgi:hypothetical protein
VHAGGRRRARAHAVGGEVQKVNDRGGNEVTRPSAAQKKKKKKKKKRRFIYRRSPSKKKKK